MNTLPLIASSYRDAANVIPAFDYEVQPVTEIRAALEQAYGMKYGSADLVAKEEIYFPGTAGDPQVRALLYRPKGAEGAVPGMLHIHGGGWIAGTADIMASFCADLSSQHGIVVLSVDYRRAPETVFPGPHNDCYAALEWLHTNASELGVDPARIAVLGDSAGGNLSAGIALRARDEGKIALKAQFLLYPALDDRTGTDQAPVENPSTGEFVVTRKYVRQLYQARLGTDPLDAQQMTYFAPTRATDLANVAPMFLAVGSVDLFLDEDCDYALRLSRAGVPVELHVYRGVFHAFDLIPGATTDRFNADLNYAIQAFLNDPPTTRA